MAMAPRKAPQLHLLERKLDDPELLVACQHFDDARSEWEKQGKELRKSMEGYKAQIKARIKQMGLPVDIYRLGEWTFEVKEQGGGGFAVKAWSTLTFSLKASGGEAG